MDADAVRERAADLPTEPGVYQFRAGETTLYVGKAVNLRNRVRSYADPRSGRIRGMVGRADRIEFAVTDTETQALLLEANLIKRRLRPRYNVRLKDDKSYPLVAITDHPVPRIEVTRDPEEGAVAYGPFTSKGRVETVVKAIRDEYRLRGCSDHKYANRDRPCLDYEMGICSAPVPARSTPRATPRTLRPPAGSSRARRASSLTPASADGGRRRERGVRARREPPGPARSGRGVPR